MAKKKHECLLCDKHWHAFEEEEVFSRLKARKEGLTEEEVNERRAVYGLNTLPTKKPPTLLQILFHQILNPLIFILIAAGIASLVIGEVTDAIFIFAVIVLNSSLGAYQEYNAERSASSLQKLLKIQAKVRRNGKESEIPSEELVPGDIVLVESGNKVPADMRLIQTNNLTSDESFLTGESIAALKQLGIVAEDTTIGDRKNIAFAGSTIASGRGTGIVIGTGIETQVGMIAQSVAQSKSAKPPLVHRMEKFTKNISILVVIISMALAGLLWYHGSDAASIFFFVVALAVSAIPEGLPVAITVALSIATRRMSKRNVIVRRLTAVESLGSCTVIASDKTGTLTVNQQTARQFRCPDGTSFSISGEGYNDKGGLQGAGGAEIGEEPMAQIREVAKLTALANEGSLVQENGVWKHSGDAMDVAFLSLAYKAGSDPVAIRSETKILGEIPYESDNKFSAAFYENDGKPYAAVKGAMETILDFCSDAMAPGGKAPLNRAQVEQYAEEMAAEGLRVLAVAGGACPDYLQALDTDPKKLSGLTIYGLVGFIDPLRFEAIEAVQTCKAAGLKVIMITGDHPITAGAIAKDLGLGEGSDVVVTGRQLIETGSPESPEFARLVASSSVFARVAPTQKLEIVDVLIKQGEFVAVTGDGVNDTPALQRANIGVAMGSGTDAAKEVGSMIIADDNFSSIVAGVEEGRFAYDNVRKVTYLLISTGAAEVLLFTASIIAQLPLPLLAVQLLWLNLVTNGIQDVALAFEGGEPGAMKRKPRRPKEKMFNPLMIKQTLISGLAMGAITFAMWYWLIEYVGMDEFSARNIILLQFVLLQNIHVFNCRSEYISAFRIPISRNYLLIFGVILAQGIHVLSMQLPFMQNLLRIEPVRMDYWLLLLGIALALLLVMEAFKFFRKKFGVAA